MTTPTFYAPEAGDGTGEEVVLGEDEAGHVHALRLRVGDAARITDGRGGAWRARLVRREGGEVVFRLLDPVDAAPPLPVELAFGVANKDRTLWMVEKAVELGVRSLQPVEFRRSRSVADAARSPSFWEKAGRRAVAAVKQCRGAHVPEIGPVRDLHDYLDRAQRTPRAGGRGRGVAVLLSRAGSVSLRTALQRWDGTSPLRLMLGPEGGLEDAEAEACRSAGWTPASLGPRILRFETAAVAALAVATQEATAGGDGEGGD